jgi:pyruvate/2-oxoglutarate dehydrogenase complex dihydrolipoamide dehydrogenase (E3) component
MGGIVCFLRLMNNRPSALGLVTFDPATEGRGMTNSTHYDAIVIGAGQGGGPLSSALAKAGRRTALIERDLVGGTCINYGCTPTKTMVASGRVAYLARRAADFGVKTGTISVNQETVRTRKREIVGSFRSGSEKRLAGTKGLDLVYGDASFAGPNALRISTREGTVRNVTADLIFIDTGTRSSTPKIDGIEHVPYLDSTSIMELAETPDHLIVLGGGYIGLEFAQMFRRFGSDVTVVQRGGKLLSREDDDIAEAIQQILEEDGISVLLHAEATGAQKDGDGVRVTLKTADGERSISGSHLLVAIGRTPNTDDLNLAAAGVKTDERGYVRINERLETNISGIYALGDVNGGPQFTHISYDDFRIIRDNLLEDGKRTTKDRPIPYCVFTDPELGRVGLTERQAREEGYEIKVAKMPMSSVARALEMDESRGLLKAVVDSKTDQILGGAILGVWGGEVMTQLQLAMMGKLTCKELSNAVFAHPTLGEAINNLLSRIDH